MLIYIDITVEDIESYSKERLEEFFSETIRSSRVGNHIVIVMRDLVRWVLENLQLSSLDTAHLKKISQEFSQYGGLLKDPIAKILKVVAGEQYLERVKDNVWIIGWLDLLEGSFLDKPLLLIENAASDGDLYNLIFFQECKRRQFKDITYQLVNGGGGTIYQELRRCIGDDYVVVCICDNDRITPYSAKSETLRRAEKEVNNREFVGGVFETPCREVENFLSFEILNEIYTDYDRKSYRKLIEIIKNNGEEKIDDCLWFFFDIKEGVSADTFRRKCVNSDARAWLETKYCVPDINSSDLRISGFGSRVVERFLGNEPSKATFHRHTRSEHWIRHFSGWFDLLLPFFWCRAKSRL